MTCRNLNAAGILGVTENGSLLNRTDICAVTQKVKSAMDNVGLNGASIKGKEIV